MAVGVPHPRDDLILVPVGGEAAGGAGRQRRPTLVGPNASHGLRLGDVGHLERQFCVIATNHKQPLVVGRQQDRVRAVLATAFKTAKLFEMIRHVVAVGVGDAVEPAAGATVADHVQGVEGPEQPLRGGDRHGNPLNLRDAGAVEGCGRDSHEPLVTLIAGDEPPLGVSREADPRSQFVLRHGEETLDDESRWHAERCPEVAGRSSISVAAGFANWHGRERLFPERAVGLRRVCQRPSGAHGDGRDESQAAKHGPWSRLRHDRSRSTLSSSRSMANGLRM